MHHLPTAQSSGQPAEGSSNLHTSVCDSRQSLTLCQNHNSPGESFSQELGPSHSLFTADKGVILCLGPVLHPLHIPFQKPISCTTIKSEGKKKIKGEEYHERKREAGVWGVCVITQKCHSFSDLDIMAAFEGAATGCSFDVGLPYSVTFQFFHHLTPSHGYTYHKSFQLWTEYIHYDIYSGGWK